jgi:hypothetical protein
VRLRHSTAPPALNTAPDTLRPLPFFWVFPGCTCPHLQYSLANLRSSLSSSLLCPWTNNMDILRSKLFVSVAVLFCLFLVYFASQPLTSIGLRSYLSIHDHGEWRTDNITTSEATTSTYVRSTLTVFASLLTLGKQADSLLDLKKHPQQCRVQPKIRRSAGLRRFS